MLAHLIGFCFLTGWVYPFYGLPIYSFYQEWLSGTLLCACFFLCIWQRGQQGRPYKSLVVPSTAWAVLGLFAVGALQWMAGVHPYPPAIALFGAAGVLFWMAVTLGASMTTAHAPDDQELKRMLLVVGQWILWSAILSASIVLVQVVGWDIHIFPLIRSPDLGFDRPSANLSQPNLMTLQLVLGWVVLGWMYTEEKISSLRSIAIALLFATAVFFANTRAYLLMLAALAIFSWKLDAPRARVVRWWACVILPTIFMVSAPFHASVMKSLGYVGRSVFIPYGDGRFAIWGASLQIIQDHPFFGVGLGAYATGFYDQATSSFGKIGATGNAHNVWLQIAAECGLFAGLSILVLMAQWLFKALRNRNQPQWVVFFNAAIGAMFAHSLVEFPLWFIFFLVPAGFFLGVTSQANGSKVHTVGPGYPYAMLGVIPAVIVSGWMYLDYMKVREFFEDAVTIRNSQAIENLRAYEQPSWLSWHIRYAQFLFMDESKVSPEHMWATGRAVVPRFPFSMGLMRFARVSASTNHMDDARKAMTVLYQMKPRAYQAFKAEIFDGCQPDHPQAMSYCPLKEMVDEIPQEVK